MHCAYLCRFLRVWPHPGRLGAEQIVGAGGDVTGPQREASSLPELLSGLKTVPWGLLLQCPVSSWQALEGEKCQVKLSKCQQRLREGPQGRLLTSTYIYELWLGMGFFCLLMGNGEEILCPLSSTCCPVARPQRKVQLNTDTCWKRKGVTQWCCQPARAGRLYCCPALPHRGGSVGRFSPDTPGGQKETHWVLLEATP